MDAIRFESRERVCVRPEALAAIRAAYDRGQYLDAWELAQSVGPLEAWIGTDALALAGRLGGEHRALGPYYLCQVELTSAIRAGASGGDRREGFALALRHLRAADAAMPRRATSPWLRRAWSATIRSLALRRTGRPALAALFALLVRLRVWVGQKT